MDYLCTIIDASTTYCTATTSTSTIPLGGYNGASYHEWLFVMGVGLFFLSFKSWGYFTRFLKKDK